MSYELPHFFWLFFLTPLLFALFLFLASWRARQLKKVGAVPMQARSYFNYWLKVGAFILAWLFLIMALMHPQGNPRYPKGQEEGAERAARDLILLIDASASMGVVDTRTGVSRLERAKEIAGTLIEQLAGERVALAAFTSEMTLLSPLTFDRFFVRSLLDQLQINEGGGSGTDFAALFDGVAKRFSDSDGERSRTLVLLTDGEELKDRSGALYKQVEEEIAPNFRLLTVGIGSEKGGEVPGVTFEQKPVISRLDYPFLKGLSGATWRADEWGGLELSSALLKEVRKAPAAGQAAFAVKAIRYDRYYQWPLAVAIGLLAVALFFPDTRHWLASCLLLCLLPLHAGEELFQRGQAYLEAGEFERAFESFSDLLASESLAPWQQETVEYAIGTLLLKEKRWEEAILRFEAIQIAPTAAPHLARWLHYNLAFARYQLALESDPIKALFLLRQALGAVEEAKKIDCQLQVLEGGRSCLEAEQLNLFRAVLKEEIAARLEDPKERLAALTQGERLLLFEEAVRAILSQFQQPSYHTYHLTLARSWEPLADQIDGTRPLFNEAIALWEKGDSEESQRTFERLLKEVGEKERLLFREPSLHQLLLSYQRALSQSPLQAVTLRALAKEQASLGNALLDERVASALLLLNQEEEARLYLEDAKWQVGNLAAEGGHAPLSADQLALQKAIDEQQHALRLLRKALLLQEPSDQLPLLLQSTEQRVLDRGQSFLKEVMERQRQESEESCQRMPWDRVLPLFDRGWEEALQAEKLLQSGEWQAARLNQEEAIAAWEKALQLLKNPPPSEPPSPKEEKQRELLQLLQQMEQQDRPPKAPETSTGGEGMPW